MSFMLMLYLP